MVPVPVDPAAEGPDLDGVDVFRAPAAPRPDQELAFPAVPEVSPREQRLREAGVNPALIGMLEDGDLGIIESAIGVSYFRELVEAAAARRSIRPWATSLAPNEIDAHISGIRSIVDFMGLEAREPAVRASLASRTAAAVEARRGLDAIRLGLPERDILPLRIAVSRLLDMAPSREATDEEAGFLPTPAPEAEPVRSWRRVRLQPVVSDPLRDNLRDFMRTAMAEDAARRTRRAQRDRMPGAGAGNSDDEG